MPIITSDKTQPAYDVIVVGSGAGGGQTANALTMEGVRVLMFESGRNYDPVKEAPMFQTDGQVPLRAAGTVAAAGGYGTDPDLLKTYQPGDVWPLTFTPDQRRTAAALCDTIIPADDKSPAASQVGVPDFIDEWISAPYEGHDRERQLILDGLAWIEAESLKRFQNSFPNLVLRQKAGLCEDICLVAKAKPEFKTAAQFFKRYRDLTAGGFYTTPEGMKDIGYVGNVPVANFAGPSDEALRRLGVI